MQAELATCVDDACGPGGACQTLTIVRFLLAPSPRRLSFATSRPGTVGISWQVRSVIGGFGKGGDRGVNKGDDEARDEGNGEGEGW